jgi:hypothetical protein
VFKEDSIDLGHTGKSSEEFWNGTHIIGLCIAKINHFELPSYMSLQIASIAFPK